MHVTDKVECREYDVSKNDIEEGRDNGAGSRFGDLADIPLDVQCLVASVCRNDDAKDKRFHDSKDKVREGERFQNFSRKVAPSDLHVGSISRNENDYLGHEESAPDSARTEDDVHDDGRNRSTDDTRHDKVTDGVDAHSGECIDFGIDDHAADVRGKRRPSTPSDEERRKDRAHFANERYHNEVTDKVRHAHLAREGYNFDDGDGSEQCGDGEQGREYFDTRKERLQYNVSGIAPEIVVASKERSYCTEEQSEQLPYLSL